MAALSWMKPFFSAAAFGLFCAGVTLTAEAQPVGRAIRVAAPQIKQEGQVILVQDEVVPGQEAAPMGSDGEETEEIEVAQTPVTPPGAREIRLVLLDGSVVTGELSISELNVTTDFGSLTIPIDRIRELRPGLNTYTELKEQLDGLVQNLASDLFDEREAAQRELIGYGTKITSYLAQLPDDGDSERQTRLKAIREAIEQQRELADESELENAWIDGDSIVTDHFTIVGKIENAQFELTSRYGLLTVDLSDVNYGTRAWGSRPAMSRALKLTQANFVQRQLQSSRIRVERGDRVSVRVEGSFNLVPWGQMSSPDGMPNLGTYMGKFPVGSVVAKIGNGEMIAIGADETFEAKQSGTISFGIAMLDNFANQGYDWSGEYQVRIKVEPK